MGNIVMAANAYILVNIDSTGAQGVSKKLHKHRTLHKHEHLILCRHILKTL